MICLVFKDIKNKRWTIWSTDRKTHLGYADELFVKNAEFFVNQEKSLKVKKTRKRFPHAWIIGEVQSSSFKCKTEVFYNPFTMKTFQNSQRRAVFQSNKVHMMSNGRVFVS